MSNYPKKKLELSPIPEGGKLPPQAIDLETAVLGALMLEREAMVLVGGIIKPQIMYLDKHRLILEAIISLNNQGNPVDLLTVTNELRKQGNLEMAGGAYYITELTSRVSSAANIEYHARIIQEAYMKRSAIQNAHQVLQMAYDEQSDPFEIVDFQQNKVIEALSDIDNGNTQSFNEIGKKTIEEIARKMTQKGMTGVDTGFQQLNEITGGWQKPDLIILAARPAMGKTAEAIKFALASAKSGVPCAFFSLEMSKSQLMTRVFAQETHIAGGNDFARGKIEDYQLQSLINKSEKIINLPAFIDDTAELSISNLRSKAYKLKVQHNIGLIIIDYLQLMTAKGSGNREQEISAIARGLKKIAKELDIPVIALAQLSRSVETRGGDKRPQLSDLRESGAIEQDADIVMFLYRAEYYGITEDAEGNSTAGIGELIISKHRNGSLDSVFMNFIGKYTDFRDKNEYQKPQFEVVEEFKPEQDHWSTNKAFNNTKTDF